MSDFILEFKNVMKIYSNGVVANKDINFSICEGEIHAIVGENGAGKSTLMKILFGIEQPTEGSIFFKGKKVSIPSSNHAIQMGIGMVHQHFMLVPSFTVAQNIILGMEPIKGINIDYKKAHTLIKTLSEKYNLQVNPKSITKDLSVGMKQKVEILKALIRDAKILILDEPTAVLTPQETDELFAQFRKLKKSGYTIIFISHKLREVKSICDRVTIIKKGVTMGTFSVSEMTEQEISNIMVGRDVTLSYNKKTMDPSEDTLLKVKNLFYKDKSKTPVLKDISFSLKRNKILGIAGIEGNGQRELVQILTGLKKNFQGLVQIKDKKINGLSVSALRKKGLSYIPEDRMTNGIAKDAKVKENLLGIRYNSSSIHHGALFDMKKINTFSQSLVDEYEIVCKNINEKAGSLSGGNIQKIVIARECSEIPDILIAEQPTRGVDIGAARRIHEEILHLRENHSAILLISADLSEILELSDALIVMFEGRIVAYFEDVKAVNEKDLGLYMLGINKQDDAKIRRAINEH